MECSTSLFSRECQTDEVCGLLHEECSAEFNTTCDFQCIEDGYDAEPAFATCIFNSDTNLVEFDHEMANCLPRPGKKVL